MSICRESYFINGISPCYTSTPLCCQKALFLPRADLEGAGRWPRLSSRPWNNEYDGFAKSFFAKKERFQLLIRVFDIAPYNMEGALLPEYESGSLYGMGGSQFRTKWLSANGILIFCRFSKVTTITEITNIFSTTIFKHLYIFFFMF